MMRRLLFVLLLTLCAVGLVVAQGPPIIVPVPNLPSAASLNPGDLLIITQQNDSVAAGFSTRKATLNDIIAFLQGSGAAGSVLGYSTPNALAGAVIPPIISQVSVLNANNVGWGSCPLAYSRGTSTPSSIFNGTFPEILNTASGIYWEPVLSTSPIKACQFGAVGDGSTDATAAIQFALDYALQTVNSVAHEAVCLDDGTYKTTDTIQVGYGGGAVNATPSLTLVSCNTGRNNYPGTGIDGVQISPSKVDRCAVNFQGSRMGSVKGISFNGATGVSGFIAGVQSSRPWPSAITGWFPSAYQPGGGSNPLAAGVASGGTNRYAPYAAICVDAYSGSAQAGNHYPNVTYPSWTGIVTQYSKNPSSDITFEDIGITGFAVGIVISPNNSDANGDFMKMSRIFCQYVTICGSVSQTQSRNVEFLNVVQNGGWTLYTNDTFGVQSGNTTGYCENIHAGGMYQLFSINMQIQPYFHCKAMYAEGLVRIGNFYGGGSFSGNVVMEDCNLNFYDYSISGLSPGALIEFNQDGSLFLKSCNMNGIARIPTIIHGSNNNTGRIIFTTIDGGAFQFGQKLGALGNTIGNASIMQANNFMGSGFIGQSYAGQNQVTSGPTPLLTWKAPTQASTMTAYNIDSGGGHILMGNNPIFTGTRREPLTQAVTQLTDIKGYSLSFAQGPMGIFYPFAGGNVHDPTPSIASCDVLTFGWDSSLQAAGNQQYFMHVGDMLYYDPDGTTFVVTAIAGPANMAYQITARQMNNMTVDTSGNCLASNISDPTLAVGNTYLLHTSSSVASTTTNHQLTVPMVIFFGDFAAGSTTVLNVGPLNGETISNTFSVGDPLYGLVIGNEIVIGDPGYQSPVDVGTTIATVTDAAGQNNASIVLSTAAKLTGRFPIQTLPTKGIGLVKTDLGIVTATAAQPTPTLPTCQSGIYGVTATVTDSNTNTPGMTIAGGSTNKVKAICNASNNWVVQFAL